MWRITTALYPLPADCDLCVCISNNLTQRDWLALPQQLFYHNSMDFHKEQQRAAPEAFCSFYLHSLSLCRESPHVITGSAAAEARFRFPQNVVHLVLQLKNTELTYRLWIIQFTFPHKFPKKDSLDPNTFIDHNWRRRRPLFIPMWKNLHNCSSKKLEKGTV